jgi:hypothetical protein
MPVDPAVFDADLAPHGVPGARWPDRPPQTDRAEYLGPDDVAGRLADQGAGDADQILARAGLFQRVERSAVTALTKQLQPVDFPRGHVIFAEGEPGDRLYIIISGKVKIGRGYPGRPGEPADHHGSVGHVRRAVEASVSNVRQGVVDPRRARRAARAAWAASQCRGDAEGEARERPTHDARSCQVAVWLSEIDTVPIPQSLTRGIGYSGWPNGADPRHAEERKTYSLSSARTTFPRRQSGDRHRERFHRRRVVMGRVIAGPFVEIAQARGEPKALRSCSAYPEIATDWHAPRSEEMPDFSSKTLIVNDVNVGARHR